LIGPGGEMRMKAAGIQNWTRTASPPHRSARRAGRGDGLEGTESHRVRSCRWAEAAHRGPEAFKVAQKDYTKAVMEHPQSITYRDYGTAAMAPCARFRALPTRNFSRGTFRTVDDISGETLRDLRLTRGKPSDPSHACMAGCTIKCSNVFGGEDGKIIVSPLEYETIGLMGSNLEIDSLDSIGRMNWQVNDLGWTRSRSARRWAWRPRRVDELG
jgi:aldehyde:ferredoxin oxidoreductase